MLNSFQNAAKFVTLACLLFNLSLAQATVPTTLNYQGFLTSPSTGQPITTANGSPLSMTFNVYNALTGGTALYTETQSVTVTNGTFNVQIGSVTALTTLAFDVPYYLEIVVGTSPNAQTLTPRQPLASSATALRAAVAEGLPAAPTTCTAGQFATGIDVHGNATGCAAPLQAVPGTGSNNTANGNGALASNTTGVGNTANGNGALASNTTGNNNTANGNGALASNTTGIGNTANGNVALSSNTIGGANTASGLGALYHNTTGNENTASGYGALYQNTASNGNTAVGSFALQTQYFTNNNQPWDALNTAVGYHALYNNSPSATTNGIQNTAVGANSLVGNTTGSNNVSLGSYAGFNVSTGNNNIGIGSYSGENVTTGNNNIDIGNTGATADNNKIRLGTPGTQTDTYIAGTTIHLDDATNPGSINFGGTTRQMLNLYGAGYGIGVQSNTLYFRTNLNYSWYLNGVHNDAAGNNGGGATMMTLTSSGLSVAGSVGTLSDRNAKENFVTIDSKAVLDKVASLPMQSWNYRNDDQKIRHLGPMAQDFYAAFSVGPDDKHITTVDESGVALAAIQGLNAKLEARDTDLKKVVQAQAEKIVALEKEHSEQTAQIAELKRTVEFLVARSASDSKVALAH